MKNLKQLHKKYFKEKLEEMMDSISISSVPDQFIEFTERDVEIELMIHDAEKELNSLKSISS